MAVYRQSPYSTEQGEEYRWRYTDNHHIPLNTKYRVTRDVENVQQPLFYFQKFFTDEMIQLIVDQTNLYSAQVDIGRGEGEHRHKCC